MPPNAERAKDFVLEFVSISRDFKREYVDEWREIINNFTVTPHEQTVSSVTEPYSRGRERSGAGRGTSRSRRGIVLKDGETHKAVMTYASKLTTSIFGDPRNEYIRSQPVGYEDTQKATTVTKLLRHAFNQEGMFRTFTEAIVDMLLFGTAILEVGWRRDVREMPVRTVSDQFGVTIDSTSRLPVTSYDDIDIRTVDNEDFFPDPSEYRLERMAGVAKKFQMNAIKARAMADAEIYDHAATERAIGNMARSAADDGSEDDFRPETPDTTDTHSDFVRMIGFEYWGEVPWRDDQETSRRVITVLNNEVVRDDPWPLADPELPFKALVINPIQGRFYGLSPAKVIKYAQDLQDALQILLAEAVIRQVHPPLVYDSDRDIQLSKLRAWKPTVPIGASGGINSIGTLPYGANVFSGFQLGQNLKVQMQEESGALGLIQGTGLGTKRASATEAQFSASNALDRPELAAMVLEKDALPRIGKSVLRRYQQFLLPEDLADIVGELPSSVWIGDIQGDFDIEFVGARMAQSRQQRLQAYDRLVAMAGAIPQFAQQVPWQLIAQRIIGEDLELAEVAGLVGDPNVVIRNILLQNVANAQSQTGNANGATLANQPSDITPAQSGGGILGA